MSPQRPKEAEHGQNTLMMHLAADSPQTDLQQWRLPTGFYVEPKRNPRELHMYHYVHTQDPNRHHLETQGLPTSTITTSEAPHKQNYDQGGSPQA